MSDEYDPITLNVNRQAEVRLTPHGWKMYRRDYRRIGLEFPEHLAAKQASGEPVTLMLWDAMRIFGRAFYMGANDLPFVRNEITILPDLWEKRMAELQEMAAMAKGKTPNAEV